MLDAIAKGLGAAVDAGLNWIWGEKQEDTQAKFARNAIQWKVEDAKKAGVHPLYALGAPTMNYSPISLGGASNFADVGQDIGRALGAGMPREGQVQSLSGFDQAVQGETLKGLELDNERKRGEILLLNQQLFSKPALPGRGHAMAGQASSGPAPAPQYAGLRGSIGDISTSPFVSDAQDYENRYGEMADWLSGPFIAFNDYLHTIAPGAAKWGIKKGIQYHQWKNRRR